MGAHWLLLWLKSVPENAIAITFRGACPVFVKVAIEGELAVCGFEEGLTSDV